MKAIVVGSGLAGSEAAWQLAQGGVQVALYEMRPGKLTPAHKTGLAAELVCSNSFRGADLSNAVGLLKEELRRLGSLIMAAADAAAVPAGGALAVDRVKFSQFVDNAISTHPNIERCKEEVLAVPQTSECPAIIATGPLTAEPLARSIIALTGQGQLAFYDAISPIVTWESLNTEKLFLQSRYDKGSGEDYLNVPLDKDLYYTWVAAIQNAEKYSAHTDIDSEIIAGLKPFEGCMPIEDMVERGVDTLRFGPLKPVGLTDPRTKRPPYAALQLRRDNAQGTLWNMVGMQTRMKHGDQQRVFRMLPGLEEAEFVRLGTVHRNTFINSPQCLNPTLECRLQENLFFAGQITGSEGYVESNAGGIAAGLNVLRRLRGEPLHIFPKETTIGSLLRYISDPERKDFQPMNISFGLIESYFTAESGGKRIGKKERRLLAAQKALVALDKFIHAEKIAVQQPTQAIEGAVHVCL